MKLVEVFISVHIDFEGCCCKIGILVDSVSLNGFTRKRSSLNS